MRPEIWEERRERVARCAERGLSATDVSRELGITKQTVTRYAQRFGIELKSGHERRRTPSKTINRLREMADDGKTRADAAKALGLAYGSVVRMGLAHGIEFRHAGKDTRATERAQSMADMYKSGATLQQIGDHHGITRERVRQLMTGHLGVTSKDGGQTVQSSRSRRLREAERNRKSFERHGCSWADYVAIRSLKKPTRAYASQKRNAHSRGIEWKLTLWDWWTIWQESGRWAQRGRGKGKYVMCRLQDAGAYEVGNIYIATCSHNCSVQPNNPYRLGHPDHEKVMAELARDGKSRVHKGCSVDGCDKPHYAKTLCRNHYSNQAYHARKEALEGIAA